MMGDLGRILGITGDAAPTDSELAEKQGQEFRNKMIEQSRVLEKIRGLANTLAQAKEEIKKLKGELNAEKES